MSPRSQWVDGGCATAQRVWRRPSLPTLPAPVRALAVSLALRPPARGARAAMVPPAVQPTPAAPTISPPAPVPAPAAPSPMPAAQPVEPAPAGDHGYASGDISEQRSHLFLADRIVEKWKEPDSGIWEKRAARKQHVHAKVMAWAALACAERLAQNKYIPGGRVVNGGDAAALRKLDVRAAVKQGRSPLG